MKKLAVIAVSLFSLFSLFGLASTCGREDTVAPEKGRAFEPRLIETAGYVPCIPKSLQAGEVVRKMQCGPEAEEKPDACDDVVTTRAEAAKMLATRPACIDRAIRELRRYLPVDPDAPTDLAAAYYVRAQREDQPLDFLRALEAAEQAIATRHPAALFNYALILQTLGFTDEAIAAWDELLKVEPSTLWADEARQHRLAGRQKLDARKRWDAHRNDLPAALEKGDRATIARLIEPFPRSAWIYFEEEVLGRWAENPTPQRLREARLYAEELFRRTQDRYALDAVAALAKPSSDLRKGLLLHRDGIRAERAVLRDEARALFGEAATLLERAGSPVSLSSRYFDAPEVDPHRYPHLHAQIRALRGYQHFTANRYLDSVNEYEGAHQEFARLGDRESVTNLLSSTLGMYRILEQSDLASTAAFRGRDYGALIPDPQRRNRFLGEVAALALQLGFPRAALRYQNVNVRKLQEDLAAATREDYRAGARYNLGIALRSRAGILAELDQFSGAMRDLQQAVGYASERSKTDEIYLALQVRIEEVRARTLLLRDVNGAIVAFTRAFELASKNGEYSTFRAQLLVQRATARLRTGQRAEAEEDLRAAIDLIRREQLDMLEKRERGSDEAIWASYFSRFDDAYDALIRELMQDNRPAEAFAFAEQARAYEPMNLLLNFGTVARGFSAQLGPEQTLSVANIQKHLAEGTFVIEYAVLQDRTYAWILGRNHFAVVPLTATRADVERWSEDLQEAARRGNGTAFQTGLYAPYAELVATVLTTVRPWARGPVRLVIIPDGAMHGLPFAALRERTSGQYLIQQATVSAAPSAAFYVHSLLRDRELPHRGQPSALLFGNPIFDSRLTIAHGLRPLAGAESEVREIAKLYGSRSMTRTGASATMTEFLQLAPRHEVVQVAAHGVVNTRLPFRSALLLAPSAGYDGVMDAHTLLMQFHAEQTRLMVFSACSSAGGLPVGAEGVAPLVRPILAAGVPGVIGTLWDINDATSVQLMVSFHRHYRQSSDAAVALQNAQVELLTKDQGNALALTWAPFQVTGYASSPFAVPENNNRGEPP